MAVVISIVRLPEAPPFERSRFGVRLVWMTDLVGLIIALYVSKK